MSTKVGILVLFILYCKQDVVYAYACIYLYFIVMF